MSGPFTGYAPPGIYTETRLDPAVAGLLGNLRVPAVMGTSNETKILDAYDMIRGSSASRDNQKVNEDVSSQLTGTNRDFTVANYPIVKGDGTGTTTYNINDVTVKVNDVKVIIASVDGLNGIITLALPPDAADTVTVTYWYNRTDTQVTDEDLSTQADGATTTFYTHHGPIVDGTNAGRTTTNVNNITVKVNSAIVDVSNLNGVDGAFTLSSPPAGSDVVEVTYYFNHWANTADDLPQPGLIRIIRVGYSPETSDFIENIDFAIIDDEIQWGTGYKLVINTHTTGCEFFDENQIVGQTVDDRIWNEDVSSQFTGTETELTVVHGPIVDGTGRDIVSEDPTTVIVNVNGSLVSIRKVDGAIGKVVLVTAPGGGDTVKVTYWRSRIEDDTYSMEIIVPGITGVGTYKITSSEDGRLGIAVPGAESANPSFTGANYLTGPMVTKGFTVDETVTLTFTSNTQFAVTSSNPSGSIGAGETDSTYIDPITGLIFTLSADPLYAAADTIQIDVTAAATFVTSVQPIYSVHGMRVTVNNTTNTCVGDITDLITFDKSGKEPNVGDIYYITYEYEKTDFECGLYTKFKNITNEYGPLEANNPIVLASYLMFLNGAIALILCQAEKATSSDVAADQTYFDILQRLQYPVEGINPAVILPLTTSQSVIDAISAHVSVQSSKRYRRERICFFGFATGTEPTEAGQYASAINNTRMTALYPDGAVIELVEADGSATEYVVDGSYLAAAYCGLNISTAYDVATPMTRKQVVGFKALVREMDESTMDMVANYGVTIIERKNPLVVRHALTTNMSSSLTREQNIITIRDFIQQEARRVLDPYIGRKFVRTITTDVATTLSAMLRAAIEAEIIVDFKNVSAERDSVEPDFIRAVAFYIPIFGVNYIEVQFNVRIRF